MEAVASYAQAQAEGFVPCQTIPKEIVSTNIIYLFIQYIDDKWFAELLLDNFGDYPQHPTWQAFVSELNEFVLPYFTINEWIGGYYPILTSMSQESFACKCFCITKQSGSSNVLVPDMTTHFDRLNIDKLKQRPEMPGLMQYCNVDDLLANTNIVTFAYLCQLAMHQILPLYYYSSNDCHPKVIDTGSQLTYNANRMMPFVNFINNAFFGNYYNGFTYLVGEYPFSSNDVSECLQRTLSDVRYKLPRCLYVNQGSKSDQDIALSTTATLDTSGIGADKYIGAVFLSIKDPNAILSALASKTIVMLSNPECIEFCFSYFLKADIHYVNIDIDRENITNTVSDVVSDTYRVPRYALLHNIDQYGEIWTSVITKRIYLLELFKNIAKNRASNWA